MLDFTDTQLLAWVSAFMWPLTRILGIFTSAPVFGHASLPVQTRVGLAVFIALLVAPGLPPAPEQDVLSWYGLLIVVQQFLIGVAIGFVMTLIFNGIEMAGELMGMSMGLGFATFYDPQTKGRSSVISQFLSLLALLLFMAADFHLLLLESLVHSFRSLPIEVNALHSGSFKLLAFWGAHIFSIGVQLSLPLVTALLIANLALGILTRAAPQLNLFGIGFPITMTVGFVMLGLCLPYWSTPITRLLQSGLEMIRQLN
jgi:flagellar biosynthetic protein FliR